MSFTTSWELSSGLIGPTTIKATIVVDTVSDDTITHDTQNINKIETYAVNR